MRQAVILVGQKEFFRSTLCGRAVDWRGGGPLIKIAKIVAAHELRHAVRKCQHEDDRQFVKSAVLVRQDFDWASALQVMVINKDHGNIGGEHLPVWTQGL